MNDFYTVFWHKICKNLLSFVSLFCLTNQNSITLFKKIIKLIVKKIHLNCWVRLDQNLAFICRCGELVGVEFTDVLKRRFGELVDARWLPFRFNNCSFGAIRLVDEFFSNVVLAKNKQFFCGKMNGICWGSYKVFDSVKNNSNVVNNKNFK